MRFISLIIIASFFLISCASDFRKPSAQNKNAIKQYSISEKITNRREISAAFQDYLKYTDKNDKNRLTALSRIAEIEFEIGRLLLEENDESGIIPDVNSESAHNSQFNKAIKLYKNLLRLYPRNKNNDDVLYQISRLHYLKNEHELSIKTLHDLVNKHPESSHYNEALFRLAEDYYSRKNYLQAEHTYTKIINADNNSTFYEKSLFKRGWSRFKAQQYEVAIDDFMVAISHHNFGEAKNLSKSESEQFKEYFRAIGISFSYIGDLAVLNNYFKRHPDFKHISHTYSVISDVYLKQERYTDATNIIKQFIKNYPESKDAPHAHFKMINVLQAGNFTNKVHDEIENLYMSYQPNSRYWFREGANVEQTKTVQASLRYYILLISSHFHNQYQANKEEKDYLAAQRWYKRFLSHYNAHARRSNIYYLYAQLLSEHKNYVEAVKYYELAAYDKDLVLDKNAAYATIVLTNRLYKSSKVENKQIWLNKHLRYSFLFYQMHPEHEHADKTIIHAAELAYSTKRYVEAIELAELINDNSDSHVLHQANMIIAPAYFKLKKYNDAEAIYTEILSNGRFKSGDAKSIQDRLALSIYRQAESARMNGDVHLAAFHFLRISEIVRQSDIASTAMYDAIALFMTNSMWLDAIATIKQCQSLYPNHKNNNAITKKLSVAYLNSNQELQAAREFEKISNFEEERNLRMSALWQAAEIYESKKHTESAIRSFTKYVDSYSRPYPQYIEGMHRLSKLHALSGDIKKSEQWQFRMLKTDKKTPIKQKTDRTKILISQTSLNLARNTYSLFKNIHLVDPLKVNLNKKKKSMQLAVKLYGQSSIYGFQEIVTESTYAIAEIYNDFSKSLLKSDRPKNLSDDELEQYEILLEDQAFPFEEKAIEFFETNLSHTKEGIYDQWVQLSHSRLKEIFPVRYKRVEKAEKYVNVIH